MVVETRPTEGQPEGAQCLLNTYDIQTQGLIALLLQMACQILHHRILLRKLERLLSQVAAPPSLLQIQRLPAGINPG